MLESIAQIFLEFVCYGTGELILRCLPTSYVRSELNGKTPKVEIVVRGKRKKNGKYAQHRHLKKTDKAKVETAWGKAPDGATILSADFVALLGLLFWVVIFAAGFAMTQIWL
jgi:hypothetical protein